LTRYAEIFLARHGETDHNRHLRFQGHLPVALNEFGRRQAAELARAARARGVRALWSSPLARARETAGIIGAAIGLEPRVDERLAEADAGHWTGRPFAEVQAEDPDGFAALFDGNPAFGFPGGESFVEQAERMLAALDDIAADADKPALVICHAIGIRIVLTHLGLTGNPAAVNVENADLIALRPAGAADI
jgi:broad specificity phosphatase PhoE